MASILQMRKLRVRDTLVPGEVGAAQQGRVGKEGGLCLPDLLLECSPGALFASRNLKSPGAQLAAQEPRCVKPAQNIPAGEKDAQKGGLALPGPHSQHVGLTQQALWQRVRVE